MIATTYDPIFLEFLKTASLPYVRALAYSESRLNPDSVTPSSHATGLLQVVKTVLKDYNLTHGTSYTLEDVKDPIINSKIGIELIEHIISGYAKNHPKSLATDWNSRRWVELLTMGFNAGYSEAGGVGRVVKQLESIGIPKERITVETVSQAAKEMKLSHFLYEPDRLKYWKLVTDRYFNEINPTAAKNAKTESAFKKPVVTTKANEREHDVVSDSGVATFLMLLVPIGMGVMLIKRKGGV